ncbi:hypothetical protein POM88_001573 [Heracleum sosnowskyi]|uniref:Uncharacterized protein n=1 Tax=Heracleum sosnowskyi TaxID=360622 RepID=A0AAD8JF48_9APIA|nr:hypothetical protein POM88_001573 [Heracleum sosnowskyi]
MNVAFVLSKTQKLLKFLHASFAEVLTLAELVLGRERFFSAISARGNTMLENFDPIVDVLSGRDYIPSMVYGRNIRGQDLSGMYCAILTVETDGTACLYYKTSSLQAT